MALSPASQPAPGAADTLNLLPLSDAELNGVRLAIAIAQSALQQRITRSREDVQFWSRSPEHAHVLATATANLQQAERNLAAIDMTARVASRVVLRAHVTR